jgi:hypothetical protein
MLYHKVALSSKTGRSLAIKMRKLNKRCNPGALQRAQKQQKLFFK